MKWKNFLTISLFKFNYLPVEDGKLFDLKNEDEYEKIWYKRILILNSPYQN